MSQYRYIIDIKIPSLPHTYIYVQFIKWHETAWWDTWKGDYWELPSIGNCFYIAINTYGVYPPEIYWFAIFAHVLANTVLNGMYAIIANAIRYVHKLIFIYIV